MKLTVACRSMEQEAFLEANQGLRPLLESALNSALNASDPVEAICGYLQNAAPAERLGGKKWNVCICGGGNAVHIMMADLGARDDVEVSVYAPFAPSGGTSEASRINAGLAEVKGISKHFRAELNKTPIFGTPLKVSENPADVIPDADVVIIPLPAFAHKGVMEAIAPFLKKGVYVGAMPAQGNFNITAATILGEKMEHVTLFGINQLPYQCRILEYGKTVEMVGHKNVVKVSTTPAAKDKQTAALIKHILGYIDVVPLGDFLNVTLHPTNQVIHPCIMYGLFHDYVEGSVFPNKPLFYQSTTEFTGGVLNSCSDDVQALAAALSKKLGIDLSGTPKLDEMMIEMYTGEIEDETSYKTIFATNKGYAGLYAPCVEKGNGFGPDFKYRYMTEDIPYGLCVLKGLADIVDVKLPMLEKIVIWAQGWMGKEYIVDGKLTGKDVGETTAPQALGVNTLEELKKIVVG